MLRNSAFGSLAVLLVTVAPGYTQGAKLSTCPTAAEVNASIEKFWTNYHKGQFRIKSVDGFQFSGSQFGTITQGQVEWGQSAQDTCPVRVSYTYVVTGADNQPVTQRSDDTKTHYFYKNGFSEWIFKTGS
jgi:hypothetical protein